MGNDGWELVSEHLDPQIDTHTWEYEVVTIDGYFNNIQFTDRKIKGYNEVIKYLNSLGAMRWEMIGLIPWNGGGYGVSSELMAVFKIPSINRKVRLRLKRPIS